jgi:hypothetical protein
MSSVPDSNPPASTDEKPLVAPCRALTVSAPLKWLRLGWADLIRAPQLSLAYGLVLRY